MGKRKDLCPFGEPARYETGGFNVMAVGLTAGEEQKLQPETNQSTFKGSSPVIGFLFTFFCEPWILLSSHRKAINIFKSKGTAPKISPSLCHYVGMLCTEYCEPGKKTTWLYHY